MTTRHDTGARVPGDIAWVAPQPLPHQPGTIDARQTGIDLVIAPVANRCGRLYRVQSGRNALAAGKFTHHSLAAFVVEALLSRDESMHHGSKPAGSGHILALSDAHDAGMRARPLADARGKGRSRDDR